LWVGGFGWWLHVCHGKVRNSLKLIRDNGTEQGMMRRKPQVRERDDENLVGAPWRHVTADPALVAGIEDECDRERTVDAGLRPPRRRIRTTSFVGNAGIGS